MMPLQTPLRHVDVAVLLCYAEHPGVTYARLAETLHISTSTAHAASTRLVRAGLAHRVARARTEVAHGPLLEFLQYALPYLCPATYIPRARGVSTGMSAPILAEYRNAPELQDLVIAGARALVWPSRLDTTAIGFGIVPLIASAPAVAHEDPSLYRWLALADVLRGGDARERAFARAVLPQLVATLPRGNPWSELDAALVSAEQEFDEAGAPEMSERALIDAAESGTRAYRKTLYGTARDGFSPDPLRLRYRKQLHDVVRATVWAGEAPDARTLGDRGAALGVAAADLEGFAERVLVQLSLLDDAAIMRYRITPAELRAWRERLQTTIPLPAKRQT